MGFCVLGGVFVIFTNAPKCTKMHGLIHSIAGTVAGKRMA
jgi:hypothetical protein